MPQALPFSAEPNMKLSQGCSRQRTNRVLSADFGDGYSEDAPDGLFPNYDIWNIQYIPLLSADRATVWAALDAVGAWDYFTWTPPGETSKRWKVVKDSANEAVLSGDDYQISFQLRQVR